MPCQLASVAYAVLNLLIGRDLAIGHGLVPVVLVVLVVVVAVSQVVPARLLLVADRLLRRLGSAAGVLLHTALMPQHAQPLLLLQVLVRKHALGSRPVVLGLRHLRRCVWVEPAQRDSEDCEK